MKNNNQILQFSFLFVLSLFTFSCEYNVEEVLIDDETNNTISFSETIEPIISNNCLPCHESGATLPNLTSYNSINNNIVDVKNSVVERRMPRGGRLSQEQIDAIVSWFDAGAPNN